jgi:protoheme IX farnesyltransferase
MPPVLGWTAVTGSIDPQALLLFLIIFVWTPPHFWALAIRYRDDYANAAVPMLPAVATMRTTAVRIVLYTVLLWGITIAFAPVAGMGVLYVVAAVVLGAIFCWFAVAVLRTPEPRAAMRLFGWSITYITLLFGAMAADQIVRTGL